MSGIWTKKNTKNTKEGCSLSLVTYHDQQSIGDRKIADCDVTVDAVVHGTAGNKMKTKDILFWAGATRTRTYSPKGFDKRSTVFNVSLTQLLEVCAGCKTIVQNTKSLLRKSVLHRTYTVLINSLLLSTRDSIHRFKGEANVFRVFGPHL